MQFTEFNNEISYLINVNYNLLIKGLNGFTEKRIGYK